MENPNQNAENNQNVDGYKVPGDGNAPNQMAAPSNHSFDQNPHKVTVEPKEIPGKEFNIGDKAYADSSESNFVKTVSKMNHAELEGDSDLPVEIDLSYKKPDGDR